MKVRYLVLFAVIGAIGWSGWIGYHYFFDRKDVHVSLIGCDSNHYYAGDISCLIRSNKKGKAVVLIDEKPLADIFSIEADVDYPFSIPTHAMSPGKHLFSINVTDTTYNKNRGTLSREFYVDNLPLHAGLVKPDSTYQVLQGRTLHMQFQTNKEIEKAHLALFAKEYPFFPETRNSLVYECFVPIECEELPSEYPISIEVVDKVGNKTYLDSKLQVVMYPFKKEVLHVSDEKIKKEQELGADTRRLEQEMQEITNNSPQHKLWKGKFCVPIDIDRVTCDFGTIRTTQHKGRYAHKALDVINRPKSVVWACQSGTVALKERFGFTGNTVVIDHGLGVLTMYCHLDNFADLNVGDTIAQGHPVGTLGNSGYATGYHLHWEMRLNNVAVDPMQWTKETF